MRSQEALQRFDAAHPQLARRADRKERLANYGWTALLVIVGLVLFFAVY